MSTPPPPPRPEPRHWLEYTALKLFAASLRPLSPRLASAIGASVGTVLGRVMVGTSRKTQLRIAAALPALSPTEHRAIMRGMWRNLGRVLAEYTQLDRIVAGIAPGGTTPYVSIRGVEHLRPLAEAGQPAVIVTAHLANWEIMPAATAAMGLPTTVFHRPLNNPLVERWLSTIRTGLGMGLLPKGHEHGGSRRVISVMRKGAMVGMLVDQAFRGGPRSAFFGLPVRTTSAPATLAGYFGCPIHPMTVERLGGCRFEVVIHPALPLAVAADKETMQAETTRALDRWLEAWVRAHPEQWLWLHNRWKAWPEYEAHLARQAALSAEAALAAGAATPSPPSVDAADRHPAS
jgi:Kdo2-lipid IVA lauroyltransferase/acyltransferase